LTPAEASALLTETDGTERKLACAASLAEFTKDAWHILEPGTPLTWNWHLDTICGYLEAVADGRIIRLIVNIPPGTMKSLLVGVIYPAWRWIHQPSHRFLTASNDASLAIRDSMKMRDLVESHWYQSKWALKVSDEGVASDLVTIDRGQSEKHHFKNTQGGFREAIGVSGKVTGKRGDTVIWDDPHDTQQAESDIQRKAVTMKWDVAWSSRVNNLEKSARILVMQRIHLTDMTGHLLAKEGQNWKLLRIPMRYEAGNTFDAGADIGRPDLNDPRHVEGELLFPALFPEGAVRNLEIDLGSYGAAGQLQQRPSPKGGGELRREWLCHFRIPPRAGNRYILCDPAGEKKQGVPASQKRDNTAMAVIEVCDDMNYYMVDFVRDRLNLTERADLLFEWHRQYRPLGVGYERYGKDSDIAHLNDKMERSSYRFKITELGGRMSKNDRIRRLIPLLEQHRIWIPETAHRTLWSGQTVDMVKQFIEMEYLPFPVGPFDDLLDVLSRICDPDMKIVFPRLQNRPMAVTRRLTDRGIGY